MNTSAITNSKHIEQTVKGGLVIIEGCDGTGKTTLAHELLKRYQGEYIHMGYIKDHKQMFGEQARVLQYAGKEINKGKLVVIDRHWVSENVYAGVFRNDHTLGAHARMMDRAVLRMGGVYVLARHNSPEENQQANQVNSQVREEMYDDVTQVAHRYNRLWEGGDDSMPDYVGALIRGGGVKNRRDWLEYNFNTTTLAAAVEAIHKRSLELRSSQIICGTNHAFTNWLGHASLSNVLVVGSYSRYTKGGWPYFGFDKCSTYVAKAMQRAVVDESSLAWVNATEPFAREAIAGWVLLSVQTRKPFKIIAFGGQAGGLLAQMQVPFGTVPDPATARRVNYPVESFAAEIKEALK